MHVMCVCLTPMTANMQCEYLTIVKIAEVMHLSVVRQTALAKLVCCVVELQVIVQIYLEG